MSVRVWADVGGTFTDCIVRDSRGQRETKVLSSGVVRAAARIVDSHTFRLDDLPPVRTDGFWVGATVSPLTSVADSAPLGKIVRQTGTNVVLDTVVDLEPGETSVQVDIDAGLEAPVLATRMLLGIPLSTELPPLDVRMGTTRGTNALLTRQGARTALLVTQGFGDLLDIGEQDRPDLFALAINKVPPLTTRVVEVRERLAADGSVVEPLDANSLRDDLMGLREDGIESLAICLLHAYVNDLHELAAEQLARELGFSDLSRSSEVAPLIKLVSRAETTTLDAYLNPILAGYVARVQQQFGGAENCRLRLMTSGGNLATPAAFRGRDSILSGPAGGVVALSHVAAAAGADGAIGIDMGGTSTDVSRYEGRVGRRYETRVSGIRVMTPMMDIETVAAGGGSICDVDQDGRMHVGPASAGADPGPACYGRGGPLTVTDLNLVLRRIPEHRFPFRLDHSASRDRLEAARQKLPQTSRLDSIESLAEGFLNIAVTHMAEAVRTVSTAQGSDARQMALVGFGGAAGQHLCQVAEALGMKRILDHPEAGILSALGMGLANVGRVVTRGVYQTLSAETITAVERVVSDLMSEADEQLASEAAEEGGTTEFTCRHDVQCDLRYLGTESTIEIDCRPTSTLESRFHHAHRATFGYAQDGREVELVAIRCDATIQSHTSLNHAPRDQVEPNSANRVERETSDEPRKQAFWLGGRQIEAAIIDRESVVPGQSIAAPAMVVGKHSTLLIEPGWQGNVIEDGVIELTPVDPELVVTQHPTGDVTSDPVLLEIIARRLQGIADSMGEVLRRTAISVNVKERRDYSCAVFRGDGSLVANAPHVPVHLGAMGHTVRHLMSVFQSMQPGDCFLTNDPYAGGSHLPDLTVVTPVFCAGKMMAGSNLAGPDFFVASRAHHAEIGGRTPGSMPPDACSLAEEGVLIRDFALIQFGESNLEQLREILSTGRYPSRCVEENLADIAAQQAAGMQGARALQDLANHYTVEVIDTLMGRLLSVAGDSMSRWIQSLPSAAMTFADRLDDGSEIGVTIHRTGDRLSVDFRTADVHPHGFNATPAIVTAAALYVFRTVCGTNLPLCDGVLRDVDLNIPVGLLNPPRHDDPAKCAAVVAGNVETSQRVVDVLLGALAVAAASQGTMNNVLMGDDTFGYYETICGGSGATAEQAGADAVHTHMTNTRITDPELLETRLPVRLHRFAIRLDSGGAGAHRGGNGVVREFEFLRPLVVSLLTGRRKTSPYGVAGGESGKPGHNRWIKSHETIELPPCVTFNAATGDRLCIETPGGGGWGRSRSSTSSSS